MWDKVSGFAAFPRLIGIGKQEALYEKHQEQIIICHIAKRFCAKQLPRHAKS